MTDACLTCPMAEQCAKREEECEILLSWMVEDARSEYYRAWFQYVGEFTDF